MVNMLFLRVTTLCLVFTLTAGATLRTHSAARRGGSESDGDDDGGDGGDGGEGGMAGALGSLFAGGGGGGDGAEDDDDANMVGGHHKKKKADGGVDVSGLEKGLANGGVGQLMSMLTAMRAAHGKADTHIIKKKNGEEMYDFRDLDDGATTFAPIVVTQAPLILTARPTLVPMPEMPTIALPGKGGAISNLAAAEAQAAAAEQADRKAAAAAHAHRTTPGKYVAWGNSAAPNLPAQSAQPAVRQPMAVSVPQVPQVPMTQMAPSAGGSSPSNLYAGLALLRQKMDALMDQASGTHSVGDTPSSDDAAKLDQVSKKLMAEEDKMEKRLDVQAKQMKALEAQNAAMKKQIGKQAKEMKAVEKTLKAQSADKVHKVQQAMMQEPQEEKQQLRGQVLKVGGSDDKKAQVPVPVGQAPVAKTLVAQAPVAQAPVAQAPVAQAPVAQAPVAPAPVAQAPVAQAPVAPAPVVQAPVAQAPVAPASVAQAQVAQAPVAQAPVAQAPVAQALVAPVEQKAQAQAPVAMSLRKASSTNKTASVAKVSAYATEPWEATFKVHLDGKAGGKQDSFTVRVHPEWAPEGAKRFQDMLQAGILKDARFFRVVPGFMVQFGIPALPKDAAVWLKRRIPDDAVTQNNVRGMMSFATSGANTRTTQMFVNYGNNDFLDKQGFAPFAEVVGDGMEVVDKIQSKYKQRPNQGKIQQHGNSYLLKHFPELSSIDHVDSPLTNAASFIQNAHQGKAVVQQQVVHEEKPKKPKSYLDDVDDNEDEEDDHSKAEDEDDDDF